MRPETILVVAAHPDDEILGVGGFLYQQIKRKTKAFVLVLNTFDKTRYKGSGDLHEELFASLELIGVEGIMTETFVDSEFHAQSHRQMVEAIENAIKTTKPTMVITHNPSDVNSDHYWTAQSVQEAMRYGQRGIYGAPPVSTLLYMEVLSSTDWGVNTALQPFSPNVFFEISEEDLEKKIEALSLYQGVIRPSPHPRNPENIRALARTRGAQAGFHFAEAFACPFQTRSIT